MYQDDIKQRTPHQLNVKLGKLLGTYPIKSINFCNADGFKFLLNYLNNTDFYIDVRQSDIDCLSDNRNGQWIACLFHKTNNKISGPWSGKDENFYTSVVKATIEAVEWKNDLQNKGLRETYLNY